MLLSYDNLGLGFFREEVVLLPQVKFFGSARIQVFPRICRIGSVQLVWKRRGEERRFRCPGLVKKDERGKICLWIVYSNDRVCTCLVLLGCFRVSNIQRGREKRILLCVRYWEPVAVFRYGCHGISWYMITPLLRGEGQE